MSASDQMPSRDPTLRFVSVSGIETSADTIELSPAVVSANAQ